MYHHALPSGMAAWRLGIELCVQVWLVSSTASLLACSPLYPSGSWPSLHLNKVTVERLMMISGGPREAKLWGHVPGLAAAKSKPRQPGPGGEPRGSSCWNMEEAWSYGEGCVAAAVGVRGPQPLPAQGPAGKAPGANTPLSFSFCPSVHR